MSGAESDVTGAESDASGVESDVTGAECVKLCVQVTNKMSASVALYGGTFDPVHFGHLIGVRQAAEVLGLDRVIFLPCAHPPHKPVAELAASVHRSQMVQLAIEGEPLFEFHEHDLTHAGPIFAIDTVRYFQASLPDAALCWIIGADSLMELPTWKDASAFVDACQIVTLRRPGWDVAQTGALRDSFSDRQVDRLLDGVVDTHEIEISGSDIRRRVRAGLSIRYLVPESVREYIERAGIYRS